MGIDRIGKGGAPPATLAEPLEKKSSVAETFSVHPSDARAEVHGVGAAEEAHGARALARLRAGEIDVHGYVHLKLDEATQGLDGLSGTDLADLRKVLEDQLATDPGLVDLVRQATGKTPEVPVD